MKCLVVYTSGCYRSVWERLPDERFRRKMDMRDRYFDGLASEAELDEAIKAADDVPHEVCIAAWDSISPQAQVHILHDLFGNPFRLVTFDPSWRTSSVVNLAQGIYDHSAFDCLPLLAAALEEVGCRNAELLEAVPKGHFP